MRGGRLVFRNLGFRARTGEVVSIQGPNGSGKTSLLRITAGLLRVTAGAIRFHSGEREITDAEERGGCAGWLGHQDAIKPQLTPEEALRFYSALYGKSAKPAEIGAALEQFGLIRAARIPCQYLSAGQRRRLALARLTLMSRPVWLMDEPLAALDAEGKGTLRELIGAHCASGGIVLAATHDSLGLPSITLSLA